MELTESYLKNPIVIVVLKLNENWAKIIPLVEELNIFLKGKKKTLTDIQHNVRKYLSGPLGVKS